MELRREQHSAPVNMSNSISHDASSLRFLLPPSLLPPPLPPPPLPPPLPRPQSCYFYYDKSTIIVCLCLSHVFFWLPCYNAHQTRPRLHRFSVLCLLTKPQFCPQVHQSVPTACGSHSNKHVICDANAVGIPSFVSICSNVGSRQFFSNWGYARTHTHTRHTGFRVCRLVQDLLIEPHSIQILTLLCLFGYGSNQTDLENHVMQIRTGEGKSIALGGGAALLALLGFRVRCICYSQYLSQRDEKAFSELFGKLQLQNRGSERIVYSTIMEYSGMAAKFSRCHAKRV